ncbi:response regulator transcription factor [Undibacterium jejuense]|uniref:Response regulator transcription factor n=1 Tax=Undibacterium jejuense TaxID=1344949 RepID=A0A923HKW4_9BURK|nr:LytTR family DNA-binding domain-containing protein [Undibacterium jejuense]MBC3864333.1 response regulator transcription factor [Undibacterium jejuense]
MHDNLVVTAMLVDDEAPMRDYLRAGLLKVWPELQIIGEAANGIAAAEQAAQLSPDIIFLDIRMPGKNGIEAAVELAQRSQVVFVTAYNEYAIQAFERGAVDYLLKPVELERLQQTVERLQLRIREKRAQVLQSSTPDIKSTQTVVNADQQSQQMKEILQQLMLRQAPQREYLRWIQASVGNALRMISTKEIVFFRSDEKYTLVQTEQAEYLIRKSLKELEDELDPDEFWRIHRSTLVRVTAIADVTRDFRGKQLMGLKGRSEKLEISRNHAHLFQQM